VAFLAHPVAYTGYIKGKKLQSAVFKDKANSHFYNTSIGSFHLLD